MFGALAQRIRIRAAKVRREEAPKLAAHSDAIDLNPKLFARMKAMYDRRENADSLPSSSISRSDTT